ncbi:uncharacterized protein ARMOST_09390 [Armillaria ostoyae]|uniref:Uncharacterized protein n=3 Tax=Armillaria TaxID=47424 RepID=A0A284RBB5_ARMOS|nr:hypothetical protein ARMSODRAFT_1012142 [Armillaria solidipes]PBL00718.1 hypothetical protein ARMGADRAFT_1073056 [Armillaria gallica]SJL06054.1 uncharacterized protein ARMOST_09390 [Armillaria ostoyae]
MSVGGAFARIAHPTLRLQSPSTVSLPGTARSLKPSSSPTASHVCSRPRTSATSPFIEWDLGSWRSQSNAAVMLIAAHLQSRAR